MKLSLSNIFKGCTLLILMSMIISGCQDPILVGGELLDDEKINIGVLSDFDISTSTVPGISVITKSPTSKLYRLGEVNEYVFGKTAAEMYMKFGFSSTTTPGFITDSTARFDSLVLILKYDTLASYGKSNGLQTIKIYQLSDAYRSTDTFYSDTKLSYIPVSIAEKTTKVSPKDSVTIIEHSTGKTVKQVPQLRVRLDNTFGKSLFENKALIRDSLFRDYFRGVYVTSTSADNNPFLYGFDLSTAALNPSNTFNKLIMYYTVSDTVKKAYDFIIDNAVINRYNIDNTGSDVANFINKPQLGDSLLFTQGFGGVKTEIKFNDLLKVKDRLINKAELEFTVADIPGLEGYKKPVQLIATIKNQKGRYEFISNISQALVSGNFIPAFGGTLQKTSTGYKYTMNITNHIKKAIQNPGFIPTMYISVLAESENPERVSFFGAKHSKYPVKLNIYYTKN